LAPVNKIHHVHAIARVAEMLGEDEDWLWDVANEMDAEDGLIWVYGPSDDGAMAFTDFGIDTLTGIIEIYKTSRPAQALDRPEVTPPRPTPHAYDELHYPSSTL
jgi:hypothetical protein